MIGRTNVQGFKVEEAEYTELEYIESTGTQYIDTGFKGSETYSKIEIDFTPLEESATAVYFGATYQDSSITRGVLSLWRYFSSSKYCLMAGRTSSQVELSMNYNTDYYLIATASNGIATAILNGTEYNLAYTYTIPDNRNIFLFANNNDGTVSNFAKMKLRSAKLYDANELLAHEYIPVLDSDNIACLFDKVTETYLYNAGTGSFTAGPVIS